MKARHVVVLCAALVLAMALVVSGCGSDEEAKEELRTALDRVELSVAKFQDMGLDSTVADIKAARDEVEPLWADVVAAAREVEDADADAAEQAWQDLDQAIDAVPDDAGIMEAIGVLAPVQNLLRVAADLRAVVTPEE